MTYASLKLKFHLGEKKTGFKLHIIMIHFILLIIIFCSCGAQKSITMTHVERIEERVMPVVVGADTIEIKSTEYRFHPSPAGLPLKQGENKRGYQLSTKPQKHNSPILPPCIRGTSEAEGVKIKSTRGMNIERIETDSSRTLRMTLRPDTVFVPYTNHIRSDTIVVPDRICNEKLKQSKFMNIILLIFLTLFVATIIYRKIFHK